MGDMRRYFFIIVTVFSFFTVFVWTQPMWPTFQYDNQRTGRCPCIGPNTPDTLWTYTPGSTILWSSPVIGDDGTIYFGCQDGYLYAINPDGSLKWTYMTYGEVLSSPAIGTDSTIYFGSSDDKLYAIEDSITYGKLRWTYSASSAIRSPILIGSDGTIYTGNMYAINQTGNLKWTYNSGISGSTGGPAMSHDNSCLYVQHATAFDYYLACVDTNGSVIWERDIGSAPMDFSRSTPTVGSDGVIYYPTGFGGPLYAINPNSTIKWTCPGLGDLRHTSAGIGVGDTIYMAGGFGRNFHAITPAGTQFWTLNTANYVTSSPIIDANGIIYIASYDTLFAINPDGSVKWTLGLEIYTTSTPAMDTSGSIYICSGTRLYAIGPGGGPGIEDNQLEQPTKEFALQIHPNPFRQMTEIRWKIPENQMQTRPASQGEAGDVRCNPSTSLGTGMQDISLKIFDVSGRIVKVFDLASGILPLTSAVFWDGTDEQGQKVKSGVYFCKIEVNDLTQTKKIIVIE